MLDPAGEARPAPRAPAPTGRAATGATYARIIAPPRPRTPSTDTFGRPRWIRRTRLGDRLWVAVRSRVRRRR
ncbi:hypothetical protein [Micromonospora sp. IBHARD004]|uniref:hypothetical protein n=1 Tax=Micromonospora sp. IBHARD004 TaxID=3457764 RepID=UPI004058AE50